ncbi:hypothetical protein BT96DRAFT_1006600 [Gymnopus androsaceus JB14]|uniref:Uncharacterized protein n=1 Tax=Gymnopus androsaceus JB14 TaxID=1447944 RepID=A0A6A4GKV3_9AGAR|nr:hypothetical protein BT96DRAFT_1006600 [Gymnopus androsaceus JB14]
MSQLEALDKTIFVGSTLSGTKSTTSVLNIPTRSLGQNYLCQLYTLWLLPILTSTLKHSLVLMIYYNYSLVHGECCWVHPVPILHLKLAMLEDYGMLPVLADKLLFAYHIELSGGCRNVDLAS